MIIHLRTGYATWRTRRLSYRTFRAASILIYISKQGSRPQQALGQKSVPIRRWPDRAVRSSHSLPGCVLLDHTRQRQRQQRRDDKYRYIQTYSDAAATAQARRDSTSDITLFGRGTYGPDCDFACDLGADVVCASRCAGGRVKSDSCPAGRAWR